MFRKTIVRLLVSTILLALLSACGGGKTENKGGEGVHQVGEAVTITDVVITLNSGSVVSNKVKTNFTVKNNGASDLAIDPATFFTIAADSDGEVVKMEIDPNCLTNVLKGSVPAGGELTGDVCWRSDPTLTWPATARITYGSATWEVKAGG